MEQDTQKERIRKSAYLTNAEKKTFSRFAKSFTTQVDAAEAMGIDLGTYNRIKELGRGNSENINIIRQKLIEWNHAKYAA